MATKLSDLEQKFNNALDEMNKNAVDDLIDGNVVYLFGMNLMSKIDMDRYSLAESVKNNIKLSEKLKFK